MDNWIADEVLYQVLIHSTMVFEASLNLAMKLICSLSVRNPSITEYFKSI
jgi:hypothetical protein